MLLFNLFVCFCFFFVGDFGRGCDEDVESLVVIKVRRVLYC